MAKVYSNGTIVAARRYGSKECRSNVSEMKERDAKRENVDECGHRKELDRTPGRVSFVMTVWLEPQDVEAAPEWRWRVLRIGTNDVAYFRRVADVLTFIADDSGLPCPT